MCYCAYRTLLAMTPEEEKAFLLLRSDIDVLAFVGLKPETVLQSLPQWDSLTMLLVMEHAATYYGRTLSGVQLRNCRTVRDLIQLLLSR